MFSWGFPEVFLRFSLGFSEVFLRFSLGFPPPDCPQTTQDRPKITPRPPQDHPLEKLWFFIKIIVFSLEKCIFGAKKEVLHYVLKRKWSVLEKKIDFSLKRCVIQRGGRAAPSMGSVPVAEMLASEAPHAPPGAKHYVLKRKWSIRDQNYAKRM